MSESGLKKKKWFKIEDIPKVNYFMLVPIFKKYGSFIAKQGGSNYFKHILWTFEKGTAGLCYLREDFNKGINFLLEKVTNNPPWAERLNKEIIKYAKEYFAYAKLIENKDFSKSSRLELAKDFEKLIALQLNSHNSGQITTWLIDAGRQLFSNYLDYLLKDKIKISGKKINLVQAFSLLTTPEKPSFVELESGGSLNIALSIKNNKVAREIFLKNNISEIKNKLNKIEHSLRKKMQAHYKKYLWLYYNYEGSVLELDYFLEIWRLLTKDKNLKKLIKESERKFYLIKNQRAEIFKKFNFNEKERKLFNIARDIVWLKSWRKDIMYFGSYVLDKIAKEIGKRLGLSLNQVRFFCDWEVRGALLKNKFSPNELNERYKFSIVYGDSVNLPKIYTGKKAKKFLKEWQLEKQKIKKVNELTGAVAYPGKAKGIVKIVETIDDIHKMKKGDILLSETTYPALVPAMKLAGAIVTNVGGLTCHAAIVSRELKIPCIVGTKIATKILKDGDLVEVDAEKGIVKILKQ